MKTKLLLLIIPVFFLPYISCSKENPAKSPLLEHVAGMSALKPGGDCSDYYTGGTLKAADSYAGKNGGTEILSGLDRKIFVKGSSYDIVSESQNGTDAEIRLRITEHPSPNMTGFEITLRLSFEDGKWKIDREKQIKSLFR